MPTWTERNTGLIKKWWKPSTILDSEIVAVYQPFAETSLADSYINLVDPGVNDAAPGIVPGWARATGWTFANNEYLTTGITPDANYTIFIEAAITAATGGTKSMMGQFVNNGANLLAANASIISGHVTYQGSWQYANISFGGSSDATGKTIYRFNQCLSKNKAYLNGALVDTLAGTYSGSPIAMFIGAHNQAGVATDKFTGRILAVAIYNVELTAAEVAFISIQASELTEFDDPTPNINYIVQHPKTRHLNNANHELMIATNTGIFRTFNGGRGWAKLTLPDPSNAEFGDSPAAVVSELTFHWVDYDPLDKETIFVMATKASTSRIWIYKTTDSGETWTSRG